MLDIVEDAVLCATNEGSLYDRFLKNAIQERKGGYALDQPGYQNTAAKIWATLACAYLPTFYRTTDQRMTASQILRFAAGLADYYRQHLEEWTPQERAALAKRLFIA